MTKNELLKQAWVSLKNLYPTLAIIQVEEFDEYSIKFYYLDKYHGYKTKTSFVDLDYITRSTTQNE